MANVALARPGGDAIVRRLSLFDRLRARYLVWFGIAWVANFLVSGILMLSRASGDNSALTELPLDDSWIHLVYVRSLVTQGCLCYNDGVWEAGATSWSWVLVNAPFYLIGTVALGIGAAAVIKMVGITVAAIATVTFFQLARRVSRNSVFPWIVCGLIVIEPTWAFHRVSGMEAPIVVATAAGAILALLNDKRVLGGLLLAGAFWARPESGVFVAIAIGAYLIQWALKNKGIVQDALRESWLIPFSNEPRMQTDRAVERWKLARGEWSIVWIPAIPLASLVIWVAYNLWINGTIYPNTYLAKHDFSLPLIPWDNIGRVIRWGLMDWQPWFIGWIFPFSLAVIVLAGWYSWRRGGVMYVALLAFTPAMVVAVAKGLTFGPLAWNFTARRYVDPVVPFVVFFLVLGIYILLTIVRRNAVTQFTHLRHRVAFLLPIYVGIVAVSILFVSGTVQNWQQMFHDYSWHGKNIADEDVAAGLWIEKNVPFDATVMIADAGAIRYFGNRHTLDAVGLNYHQVIGRDQMDIFVSERPEYVASWAIPAFDELPNATKHLHLTTEKNTILGGGPVGVYQIDWSDELVGDASLIYLEGVGGEVIDMLDLGDRASEDGHSYFISFVAFAPWAIGSLDGQVIVERGLSHPNEVVERFAMAAIPGEDLTVVLRYRPNDANAHPIPIYIDGVEAGELFIEPSQQQFVETSITIPGEFVSSDTVEIQTEWDFNVTQFRWWTVAEE